MTELIEQIKQVAFLRDITSKAKVEKDKLYQRWVESHKDIFDAIDEYSTKLSDAETKLREMTIQAYQETGNKTPAPGVGIRELTKIEYDPRVALTFATEHKMFLSLDKKTFDAYAKTQNLDFVTITKEPQATIATDLSQVATP